MFFDDPPHPSRAADGAGLADQLIGYCDRLFSETGSIDSTHEMFSRVYDLIHASLNGPAFEEFDERLSMRFDTGKHDAWYLAVAAC